MLFAICFLLFSMTTLLQLGVCHNVNTQNVKIARRDRPHILASHRYETFGNLYFYILISLQWGELFQGFYSQKIERWFLSVSGAHDSVSIASLYMFRTWKMCKFSKTLYNRQLIQFTSHVSAELVVRFIRYQNRVQVITLFIAA